MVGILTGVRMLALGGFITVAAGGYWYYVKSQEQINDLQNLAAQSNAAIEIQKQFIAKQSDVINTITENVELMQQMQEELILAQRASKKEVADLKNKFNTNSAGKDRDIGELAFAKPGLIEKVINKAIKTVGAEIEEITQ